MRKDPILKIACNRLPIDAEENLCMFTIRQAAAATELAKAQVIRLRDFLINLQPMSKSRLGGY